MRPGKAREKRPEITRRNDNDATRDFGDNDGKSGEMFRRDKDRGRCSITSTSIRTMTSIIPSWGEVAFIGNSGHHVHPWAGSRQRRAAASAISMPVTS